MSSNVANVDILWLFHCLSHHPPVRYQIRATIVIGWLPLQHQGLTSEHGDKWWQVTTKSTKLLKPPNGAKPFENSPILPACSSPSVAARAVPQRPGETAPVCPMTCMSSSDQQHTTIENMVSTELESQDLLWIHKFNNLCNQYDLVCSKNVCHELSWMLMPLQQVQHRPEKACVVPRSIRTFAPSLVHGPNPDDVNLRSCKLMKLIRLLWF